MGEPVQAREATFYNYKLIRKIYLRPESKYSYIASALLLLTVLYLINRWIGLLYAFMGLALMLIVHAIVLRITVRRVDQLSEKRWAFRRDFPWLGPLPILDTQLSLFRWLHFHLALVGCCVSALFYPWAPSSLVVAMTYWHIWLLSPRIKLLWELRKERRDGVVRLESKEVSFYHQ